MVLDGKLDPNCRSASSLTFSPDGGRFAYAVSVGGSDPKGLGREYVFVDGKLIGPYHWGADRLSFSSNGKRFGFVAHSFLKKIGTNAYSVVLDGEPGGPWQKIPRLEMSLDNRSVAYVAETGRNYRVVVIWNEKQVGDYQSVEAKTMQFSEDGQHLAFVARDGREFVVVDGVAGMEFDDIKHDSLVLCASGERYGYVARNNQASYVVVDGEKSGVYNDCSRPAFSPNSKRWACRVMNTKGEQLVIVDGQEGETFSGSGKTRVIFSPDSNRVAYNSCYRVKGYGPDETVVVDGVVGSLHHDVIPQSLQFSSDSQVIAFVAKDDKDKHYVVRNEERGPLFDEIYPATLQFSPDGRQLGYVARNGKDLSAEWFVVVNHQQGPACQSIGSFGGMFDRFRREERPPLRDVGFTFQKDGSLEYLAVRGDALVRIKQCPALDLDR